MLDLGVGFDADSLWFNLKPGGLGPGDRRAPWLQHDVLRRAISLAVDRQLFANTVFLGAGVPVYGPITPANRKWFANLPPMPHDPERAKRELATIGLTDRNGDGLLEDANNQPVRFSLLAQKGNTSIERGAAVIRDELKKIGVTVDVVALDGNSVIQRFLSGKYDAVYFRVTTTDTDPADQPGFLAQLGQRARLEPRAEDAGDRVGSAHRRLDAPTDGVARRGRAQAAVRRGADDLRRAPADDSVRRAADLRGGVGASSRTSTPTAFTRPQLLWSPDTIAVVH